MAIIGTLLQKGIRLRESLEQQYTSKGELQKNELRKLLIATRHTAFGNAYNYAEVLKQFKKANDQYYDHFTKQVPVFDYDKLYNTWWYKARNGEKDVCWPDKIKYFALSSGTSGASSKYIPVTKDILKSMNRTSIRQILTLSKYDLPSDHFTKGILMLGGSTNLRKNGHYFEGDLSGITTSQIPFWFQHFYKPGRQIAKTSDWGHKLEEITKKAKDWDIGIIVGVPAWLQILMEKIIKYYQVDNIHDVWPNLKIFVHGGVSFEPYKKSFNKLLGHPLHYIETYLASEGFIAFQAKPGSKSMKLVLNNGIFYEFIPFNTENFTEEGELLDNPKTLKIDQVEEHKEYALLISTNAGTWRYLIGDVIKFTNAYEAEIVITGRTKLFLSLCGEHLSMDNINKAVELVSDNLNFDIREFAVAGMPDGLLFEHHWFIGSDTNIDPSIILEKLDACLKEINDDYAVERKHALKNVRLTILPSQVFYDWMKNNGKEGGQNKFPRVLKKEKLINWLDYLNSRNLMAS